MAWVSKKKITKNIAALENEIKELREELKKVPTYDDKMKELAEIQRIVRQGVPHKLSAEAVTEWEPTFFGSRISEILIRLYISGHEYEIRNISELDNWFSKLENADNPSVELQDNGLVSILFTVDDEHIELIEVLANYKQGNYIFKTYEREQDEKEGTKTSKKANKK